MNPVLGWFAAEVLAPEVAARAYNRLRDRDWRTRLADRVAENLTFRISRKRVRRWLGREETWEALTAPTPERVESLLAAARTVIRSRWPWTSTAEAVLEERSAELVAGVIREFLSSVDASYAVAIAHVRQMHELRSIATDTSQILERLDRPGQFEAHLTRLPPGTDSQLRALHGSSSLAAEQLAALLVGEAAVEVAVQLVRSPPAWLEGCSGAAWAALSEFAGAHRLGDVSAKAAERAVEAVIPRPARWLAKAASQVRIDEPTRAAELLARAEHLSGSRDLFVTAVGADLTKEADKIREVLSEIPADDPDALTLLSYRAQVELLQDDVDAAISTLDAVTARAPGAAGVLLLAADVWLRIASLDDRVGRTSALQKVVDFAQRAREERRRWNGPSFEASRELCRAAALALDWESVLRAGLPEPEGEATSDEAADTEVLSWVFQAALALDNEGLAREIAERLATTSTDAFEIAMSGALLTPDRSRRVEKLLTAWDLAASAENRFRVQYLLARAGELEIPGLDELQAFDSELALVLRATGHLARGEGAAAVELLRPFRNRSRRVAMTLAQAYEQSGDVDDAVGALRHAAQRFNDPLLISFAAEVLYRAGRLVDAQEEAHKAIALLTEHPGPRATARRLLIEIDMTASDWAGAEAQARALLAEEGQDPAVRWMLVIALIQQGRLDVAFGELCEHQLTPVTEFQALAWLDLHRRFATDDRTVSSMLALAEKWSSSEQVWAAALTSAYETSRGLELPDHTVRSLHRLTDEFFTVHPDSERFRRIEFQDVDELIAQLQGDLAAGASHFDQLTTQVNLGQLPYGMLSAAAGRPYAEAVLRRAAGALLLSSPDPDLSSRELEAAQGVLDGRAVVDASFLHTMALLPDLWSIVYGQLRSVLITDVALHDLSETQRVLGLRTTGSIGWDPRAGKPVISEITEEESELLAVRSTWMAEEARRRAEVVSWRQLRSFPDLQLDRFGPWLTPLDLAAEEGLTLVADDYALRSLASSLSIPTCGSMALMQVLVKAGHVSVRHFEHALLVLRKNRGVDFPVDEAQMVALAADDDDARSACLLQVSRRAFWKDLTEATSCFGSVLEALANASHEWGVGAVRAATLGVIRAAGPGFEEGLVAGVLALAIVRTDIGADEIVRASRDVVNDEMGAGAEDPLPAAVTRVLTALERLGGAAMAAQLVLKRFSALNDADRRLVTQVVLRGDWHEGLTA